MPGFATASIDRHRYDAEVLSSVVYANVEESVPVIDVIFLLIQPRSDDEKDTAGRLSREVAALVGGVASSLHQEVFAVPRLADAKVEALVAFLVDQRIVRRTVPQAVPEELILPLRDLILSCVEERVRVGCPNKRAYSFRGVWQVQRLW